MEQQNTFFQRSALHRRPIRVKKHQPGHPSKLDRLASLHRKSSRVTKKPAEIPQVDLNETLISTSDDRKLLTPGKSPHLMRRQSMRKFRRNGSHRMSKKSSTVKSRMTKLVSRVFHLKPAKKVPYRKLNV